MTSICISRTISFLAVGLVLLVLPGSVYFLEAETTAVRESRESPPSSSSVSTDPTDQLDHYLARTWKDYGVTPSKPAADGEWCRRVYLDVLGRIPSVRELDAFLAESGSDKKAKLVERLLSGEYAEEYARNWTTLWTNILIGRSGGTERRSLTNREGLQQYLRDSFQQNKPYDRLVYELVSATGASKPGVEGFNGAVNFLAMKLSEDAALATSDTSRIFLGIRVQCTQCHDHPFNKWKQNQFWEFNSFFRQTAALRRFNGRDINYIELVNQDFAGEGGDPDEAEVYYERRNGIMKVAYPVFRDLDGSETTLPQSGYLEDVNRREELAKLMVQSGYLPRAIVNRMWAHFFGYGLTKPFDDMGPHNRPSHPELLQALADRFKSSGYDLKHLIRWLTLSRAYGLSSKFHEGNRSDDPTLGSSPLFSRFYLRQMRAEELYESLLVATLAHKTRGDYEQQEKAKRKWLDQFVIAFGTDENDETTTFDGTIPQALMMFNGELIKKATSSEPGSFLHRVASNNRLRGPAKINYLYKAALAREPTTAERTAANRVLASHRGDQAAALQDVWWAVLNTNEFILNH